ncbi:hypothetical protein BH20ACI2_BH20ACI2_14790 [soil metagenome]
MCKKVTRSSQKIYRMSLLLASLFIFLSVTPLSLADSTVSEPSKPEASTTLVISQVYGGGGNSGAPLTNDFIEIFNKGTTPIDLSNYSVQYAAATTTGLFSTNVTALTNVTLQPGQFYLIQQAAGATPSGSLPTPDATGTIAMALGSGKVILANTTSGIACNGSSTPCSVEQLAQIVDLVGFGTANFFEGSAAAPAPSNTTSILRAGGGCTDTDQNSTDFATGAPAPRNTASPLNLCTLSTTVQFSSPTFAGSESTSAVITVTRSGNTSGTSTVTFSTVAGGTASGGSCGGADYATTSQTVTFISGETSKIVNVDLCSDLVAEPTETVNLELSGPSAGTSLGAQSTAVLSITDAASQYRNAAPISVNSGAAGNPYPSSINVSGAPTSVFRIRVTLFDFLPTPGNHVDVLLVGPNGAKYVLMAHVGVPNPPAGPVTLTFFDAAADVLPTASPLTSGTFLPTSCDPAENFPAPAPIGPYIEPGCDVDRLTSETLFGTFSGINGNGDWSLYVRDEEDPGPGTVGTFLGGWGIEFLSSTAADGVVSGRVITANGGGLRGARVTMVDSRGTAKAVMTSSLGYYRFDEVETGETYIIGVSSRRYRFSPRVVQVFDSLTEVDFVGIE